MDERGTRGKVLGRGRGYGKGEKLQGNGCTETEGRDRGGGVGE